MPSSRENEGLGERTRHPVKDPEQCTKHRCDQPAVYELISEHDVKVTFCTDHAEKMHRLDGWELTDKSKEDLNAEHQ